MEDQKQSLKLAVGALLVLWRSADAHALDKEAMRLSQLAAGLDAEADPELLNSILAAILRHSRPAA